MKSVCTKVSRTNLVLSTFILVKMEVNFEFGPFGRFVISWFSDKYGKTRKRKNSKSKSPPCCITKLMNS